MNETIFLNSKNKRKPYQPNHTITCDNHEGEILLKTFLSKSVPKTFLLRKSKSVRIYWIYRSEIMLIHPFLRLEIKHPIGTFNSAKIDVWSWVVTLFFIFVGVIKNDFLDLQSIYLLREKIDDVSYRHHLNSKKLCNFYNLFLCHGKFCHSAMSAKPDLMPR